MVSTTFIWNDVAATAWCTGTIVVVISLGSRIGRNHECPVDVTLRSKHEDGASLKLPGQTDSLPASSMAGGISASNIAGGVASSMGKSIFGSASTLGTGGSAADFFRVSKDMANNPTIMLPTIVLNIVFSSIERVDNPNSKRRIPWGETCSQRGVFQIAR